MLFRFTFDLARVALPLLIGYGQTWSFVDYESEEIEYKTIIRFSVLMVHIEIVF